MHIIFYELAQNSIFDENIYTFLIFHIVDVDVEQTIVNKIVHFLPPEQASIVKYQLAR